MNDLQILDSTPAAHGFAYEAIALARNGHDVRQKWRPRDQNPQRLKFDELSGRTL